MTLLTLAAELPQVHIILRVARSAFRAQLHLRSGLAMAAGAIQPGVRSEQRETGLLAMIEIPPLPAVGGMALLALRSEAAFVGVVLLVAIDTLRACELEGFAAAVTLIARDGHMQAQKRKLRQVMVKVDDGLPALRQMTFLAPGAEPALVNIVGLVTAHAIGDEFARADRSGVAGVAFNR
jgi:hypothetical protein